MALRYRKSYIYRIDLSDDKVMKVVGIVTHTPLGYIYGEWGSGGVMWCKICEE